MPTISVGERQMLKFISENTPTNGELRKHFTAKFIQALEEKRLITKVNRAWRLTPTGQEALTKQRPEIRRAHAAKHFAEPAPVVQLSLLEA